MRYTAHKKKENWRIDEYKSEFTSPAYQKILKNGGSNNVTKHAAKISNANDIYFA